jgi:Protein of unknown function (DUF4232)
VFSVKVSVFGSVVLAAGVLVIGCGCGVSTKTTGGTSSPAAASTGTTSSPASSPVSGASSPATSGGSQSPGQAGAAAACRTSSLRVASAPGSGGAAGSFYFDLTFTNTGSSACTLYGYPGVSFTTAGHSQLGLPAQRVTSPAQLVTLSPGSVASAQVRIVDVSVYPSSACRPTTAALIKVYPPNQTAAAYVPTSSRVCTTSQGRSGIQTVVSGAHAGV